MSNFDVAMGLSEQALNQISDGFYARSKDTVYMGTVEAAGMTIAWAALSAPEFSLSPPPLETARHVVATCDVEGKYPHLLATAAERPDLVDGVALVMATSTNGFSFTIAQLQLSFGSTAQLTVPLVARGCIVNANNATSMKLLGVSVTVDGPVNQKIVNDFLVPRLTTVLAEMLSSFQIPPLAIANLNVGATNAAVVGKAIVIFGNLAGNTAAPSIDGFSLPPTDFFALLGPNAVQAQVNSAVGGKTFGPSGSVSIGIGDADYHATVTINNPQASLAGNGLSINLGLVGSAGAGISVGCVHPSAGFDVYAQPNPTVSCSLTVSGSSIAVRAQSCSPFGVNVKATGVAIILEPFIGPIASAIGSAVTAAFSSQIISLASFPSIDVPSMPVHDSGRSMTVLPTNVGVGGDAGYLSITGQIAIS
jgi:hypothetical protein